MSHLRNMKLSLSVNVSPSFLHRRNCYPRFCYSSTCSPLYFAHMYTSLSLHLSLYKQRTAEFFAFWTLFLKYSYMISIYFFHSTWRYNNLEVFNSLIHFHCWTLSPWSDHNQHLLTQSIVNGHFLLSIFVNCYYKKYRHVVTNILVYVCGCTHARVSPGWCFSVMETAGEPFLPVLLLTHCGTFGIFGSPTL